MAPGEGRGAVEPAHQGGEMAAPGDPGGGDGFQPAPTRRGFGRFREGQRQQQVQRPVTQVPEAQRAEEEVRNQRDRRPERAGGGLAEGQDRSEGATGRRRGTIPHDIIRMMDNERKAKMVSLDFGGFAELPEIGAFHRWLKEQGVVGQDQERRSIQWVFRNEFVKKFFVHMKEDYGAEWLEQEFRGGKDWTDRATGRIIKIWARWEGQTWKEVIIRGIDPRTPRNMVEQGLKEYGEVRGLEFAQLDGITYNQAKVLVRVREGAKLPVYVFAETGETGSGQEERMERWELDYRGRPNVCFGCFKPGHVRHRCARPVTMAALIATGGAPGSYARVLRRPLSQEEVDEATRSLQLEATKVREQEEKEMDEQDPERLEREQILRKEDVCDENANVQVAAQKEAAEKQELQAEHGRQQLQQKGEGKQQRAQMLQPGVSTGLQQQEDEQQQQGEEQQQLEQSGLQQQQEEQKQQVEQMLQPGITTGLPQQGDEQQQVEQMLQPEITTGLQQQGDEQQPIEEEAIQDKSDSVNVVVREGEKMTMTMVETIVVTPGRDTPASKGQENIGQRKLKEQQQHEKEDAKKERHQRLEMQEKRKNKQRMQEEQEMKQRLQEKEREQRVQEGEARNKLKEQKTKRIQDSW